MWPGDKRGPARIKAWTDGEKAVSDKPSRRGRWIAAIAGGTAVVLGLGYVGTAAAVTDKIPDGTTIAGVDVGGMTKAKAEDAVSTRTRSMMNRPITVSAEGKKFTLDAARSGLWLDPGRAADGLTGFSLNPSVVGKHLFGARENRPLTAKADTQKLAAAITAAAGTFKGSAVNGSVKFNNGKVDVVRSKDGTGIRADAVAQQIAKGWPAKTEYTATIGHVEPPLTNAEIDAFVKDFAGPAMSGPVTVKVGAKTSKVTPVALSAVLSAKVQDGTLKPVIDEAKLREVLDTLSGELTTPAENAHYGPGGSIVEAKNGSEVDPAGAGPLLIKALTDPTRTLTLKSKPVKAAMVAADLKNLDTEKISEFVSRYPGGAQNESRTKNIQVALAKINGMVIAPGEQFSLLQSLTPITKANGYVEAGVLVDGIHEKGTGGGISQVSTTMYNAAFFAGVRLDEHTPHAYWIPRYPMGRESTLWVPTIDLRWTNDTGRPIRIEAGTQDSAAVIRLYGTKTFNVSTNTGPQFAFTEPKTRYITKKGCEVQAPAQGFKVTVTRVVTDLSGKVVKNEANTTKYIPSDKVVCGPDPNAPSTSTAPRASATGAAASSPPTTPTAPVSASASPSSTAPAATSTKK